MPTLIAVGDRYDRLTSASALLTSPDGLIWTPGVAPFDTRARALNVAAGPDRLVVSGDGGSVAFSEDQTIWIRDKIWYGNFQPLCINWSTNDVDADGMFMACGQGKFLRNEGPYAAGSEAGLIVRNYTGENWGWEIIYGYDSQNSRFYNVKRFPELVGAPWVAVGSADNKPIGLYSYDSGNTWNSITFPVVDGVNYAYDIVANPIDNQFWITGNGIVFTAPSLDAPPGAWDISQILKTPYGKADFFRIATNPAGHMVAAASGGLAYSTDRIGWKIFSAPGYQFRSVIWFEDKWVAGADSTLTHYTYWTSSDLETWTPRNNGVYIYDFAII